MTTKKSENDRPHQESHLTTRNLLDYSFPKTDDVPLTHRESTSSNYEQNLFLYHEEMPERPRVASLLSSINQYHTMMPNVGHATAPAKCANLGTIAGVYLPCIQNILGVMFFLRLSWIVGTAGIPLALVIVIISCSVTFTTVMSLSAIATNGYVPAGGSYFMISRVLGPEFGGAVGILFYLATTMAGSLYISGATEIFMSYIAPNVSLFGNPQVNPNAYVNNSRVFGTILLALISGLVLIGVRFVSKLAPVALFCVLVSVLAVYVGVFTNLNGNKNDKVCILGTRLLYHSYHHKVYQCSKDPNETDSLYDLYCPEIEGNVSCYSYFKNHDVHEKLAIPGLASGVFIRNVKSYFFEAGDFLSETKDPKLKISNNENLYSQMQVHTSTSIAFLIGIFFPSVTGILAGSNRSGDLADASKSIPAGTIAAHITTTLIYITGVLFFGGSFSQLFMRDVKGESLGGVLAVSAISWPNPLVVVVGSFLSTFGAALQSLIGAPRLLQAIAQDEIMPFLNIFSKSSANNEPVRALLFTIFVCELGILIGRLDLIAPIQTMFFLMCYMFVNLACVLQSLLRSPNWRPRFKYYHWILSLLGSLLCLVVMFLTNWYYALIAMLIALFAYKYIEYRGAEKEWGDGLRGLALSAARYSLLRLEDSPPHTKNWRPQILILCKLDKDLNPKYRKLFTFASQLKAGQGLTVIGSIIEGHIDKMYSESQAAKQSLEKVMHRERVKGFVDVLVTNDRIEGICSMIQCAGLGGLRHNTVVLGWPYRWRQSPDEMSWKLFLSTIRNVSACKRALLVPKGINFFPENHEKMHGNIDVWWIVHDGGLLMLLPFLLRQNKTWRHCKLRVFTIAQEDDNSIQMKKDLAKFLYQLRIDAEVEVVEMLHSDISGYTYERTLLMEQRSEILSQLKVSSAAGASSQGISDVRDLVDPQQRATGKISQVSFKKGHEEFGGEEEEMEEFDRPKASPKPQKKVSSIEDVLEIQPDKMNVRRMHTAVKLNEAIVSRSHFAQLVILNLPGLPRNMKLSAHYMEFLEVLTEGLERVLMVRGGGREVITIYS